MCNRLFPSRDCHMNRRVGTAFMQQGSMPSAGPCHARKKSRSPCAVTHEDPWKEYKRRHGCRTNPAWTFAALSLFDPLEPLVDY